MPYSYYDDDDYVHEGDVYNDFSGDAENVVQARDVYGEFNYYESDDDVNWYDIPNWAQPAVFAAVFLVFTSYSNLFTSTYIALFDWIKLLASTAILVVALTSAYYWSAGGLLERRYRYLRLFIVLLLAVLGYKYGAVTPLFGPLGKIISGWLIWHF